MDYKKKKALWAKRRLGVITMLSQGVPRKVIAARLGISRQRLNQIESEEKGRDRLRSFLYATWVRGTYHAKLVVDAAKRAGELQPVSGPCMDCGKPATCYDHRDYNHPLAVDPVCRSCNGKRGPGLPKRWASGEWSEFIRKTSKRRPSPLVMYYKDAIETEFPELLK